MPGLPPSAVLLDVLCGFTAQAATGVTMAFWRGRGIPYDSANHVNMKHAALASYLNDCWKSLIVGDDEYVTETFQKLSVELPNESPLCLIHKVFAVGSYIISNPPPIGSSTPKEQRVPSNAAYTDCLRNMLSGISKDIAGELFKNLFENEQEHHCSGPKLANIHQEDPNEPIFSFGPQ